MADLPRDRRYEIKVAVIVEQGDMHLLCGRRYEEIGDLLPALAALAALAALGE